MEQYNNPENMKSILHSDIRSQLEVFALFILTEHALLHRHAHLLVYFNCTKRVNIACIARFTVHMFLLLHLVDGGFSGHKQPR